MLLFGVFLAVVGMLLTRKSEIVTHDPLDGLPGQNKLGGLVDTLKETARQMEAQAREAQARAQQSQDPLGLNTQPGRRQDSKAVIIEQIKDLAQRGQAVDAIRLYRMSFRVDLKTAKEAVDRLASGG